jgi:hypothetical protein
VIERRSSAPLVPFAFFRNPSVRVANVTMLAMGAAVIGLFYFLLLYIQEVLGYSAIKAGISQLPLAAGVILAAGIASPLVARTGARTVLITGLVLFAGGLVWFASSLSMAPTSPTSSAPHCSSPSDWGWRSYRSQSFLLLASRTPSTASRQASSTQPSKSAERLDSPSWRRSQRAGPTTSSPAITCWIRR